MEYESQSMRELIKNTEMFFNLRMFQSNPSHEFKKNVFHKIFVGLNGLN